MFIISITLLWNFYSEKSIPIKTLRELYMFRWPGMRKAYHLPGLLQISFIHISLSYVKNGLDEMHLSFSV